MNYIEIKQGIKVRKSAIEFTEDLENGGCRVATINSTWDTDFPSAIIWDLIGREDIEEKVAEQTPKQPFEGMWGNQYWAG